MQTRHHTLAAQDGGTSPSVTSLHFGPAGRRALLQCSLHADEIPPMLVAQHLRQRLQALEEAGQLLGEVVLLPACNPIGLAQQVWGRLQGRFELASGQNFNRHYPALADGAARRFAAAHGRLGDDPKANAAALRTALHAELAAQAAQAALGPLQQLRHTLMRLALPADVLLDLHCDNEAVLHVYATPEHQTTALQLGRCLGAPLLLLATESGDGPFDEALSGVWPQLRVRLGPQVPLACFAATVELRGETDVSHALAAADAQGLLRFLQHQGFVRELDEPELQAGLTPPAPDCAARPLAGCMPLVAPFTGLLAWRGPVGQWVSAGQPLVDLICPTSGRSETLCSSVDGLLFGRELQRWARAGQTVAKVAGQQAQRSGKLLSA
jgi:uncharacterized protein